jgi:hypothetical protein
MQDSKPQFTDPIECRHCGNKAPMEVVATYDQVRPYEERWLQWQAGPIWELVVCPACSDVTLLHTHWVDHRDEEDPIAFRILFPSLDKPLEGLPTEIDKEYQAALKVSNISSNSFGVLLGRVIEKVCLDRGASGKTLENRLDSLAKKGEIPQRLAEMAHQLRQMRNIGAHAELGELTPAEVPVLDDLCRAILEYVYTAPRLIDQVRLKLDKLKK